MASVGNAPPAIKIDLSRAPWTGTETELREFAAYAFETAQPRRLHRSPLIRGASIDGLTKDQHAIFKAAGYPLVIVPGKGEFYIPPGLKADAERHLRAGLEPPLPPARLAELTKPRPSTRIAGAVHGLSPRTLETLAAAHWDRSPAFQLLPHLPWMVKGSDLPAGVSSLLREAGYISTDATGLSLVLNHDDQSALVQLKDGETIWTTPTTSPQFRTDVYGEGMSIRCKVLPDGNSVGSEDYHAAVKIWKPLPRVQFESTYAGIPNTPDMVRATRISSLAVTETLQKGGYTQRRAGDILAEFLVEKMGPTTQLDPNEMVWVEPYKKPDLK